MTRDLRILMLLAIATLWSCDNDSTGASGPDCRNASEACEPGFRCELESSGYTCIPERTQTPDPLMPQAGGRPTQGGAIGGSSAPNGTQTAGMSSGGVVSKGGVPAEGGALAAGAKAGGMMNGGIAVGGLASTGGMVMSGGIPDRGGQEMIGGQIRGGQMSGGQMSGGQMSGGVVGEGGRAAVGGNMNAGLNLCEDEAGGVCRNAAVCLPAEDRLRSPCRDAGQICCRMRPPEMGGEMAGGGEMAAGGAMAMNGCVQGIPGRNQCVGYFWGHRKCMPDQLGGADANGAQPILAGRDYMGIANYRPGVNTVADWFRIDVCNGGTLTVNIEYPNGGGDLHLLLQGNNLGRLDNSTDLCAGRQSVTWTNDTGRDAGVQFGVLGYGPPNRQGGENSYSMDVILVCQD